MEAEYIERKQRVMNVCLHFVRSFLLQAAEKWRKKLEMEKLAKIEERKLREEEVRAKKAALAEQRESQEMQEREDNWIELMFLTCFNC